MVFTALGESIALCIAHMKIRFSDMGFQFSTFARRILQRISLTYINVGKARASIFYGLRCSYTLNRDIRV